MQTSGFTSLDQMVDNRYRQGDSKCLRRDVVAQESSASVDAATAAAMAASTTRITLSCVSVSCFQAARTMDIASADGT